VLTSALSGAAMWDRLGAARDRTRRASDAKRIRDEEGPVQRLQRSAVESLMEGRSDTTLEAALEVFEVFASGSLTDEVYILDDVGGKRIAIAPTALKDKYRRG
jgi:hypothetical protein